MPEWLNELLPIVILLIVITVVIGRLPKVKDVDHSKAYRRRRALNWLPLGLTYAFLYMGRYNIKVSQYAFGTMKDAGGDPLMSNADFNIIFLVGTIVYGFSFIINGPLTDRFGGRLAILTGAGGVLTANLLMGLATLTMISKGPLSGFVYHNFVFIIATLYVANMYFQSFGAVAIVKVNAPWFHVRERGVFGAIFGILIALGLYFAFDWSPKVLKLLPTEWVFLTPACILATFWIIVYFIVRNTPGEAGLKDFNTADASSGDEGPRMKAVQVFKMMLKNPVIVTIACVEFCSGFIRQAVMQWYPSYAMQTDGALGLGDGFVMNNWGMLMCCAGIIGGVVAGVISDHIFQSRRGPVAAILYATMFVVAILFTLLYKTPLIGVWVVLISVCVIGVHGMLSGTASMDFGGAKNAGIAVGIIDGFVYLGTAFMSLVYLLVLPEDKLTADGQITGPAANPDNWYTWPLALIPIALIGFILATRVWNAKPKPKKT
jgi:OPA family glycerol-3-phosphate transporter-like MFS transporter